MRGKCFLAIGATLAGMPISVGAQGAGLEQAVRQCAAERDDARRLACYDAEAARLGTLPPPPTPEQKFGARGDLAQQQESGGRHAEPKLERLDATVTGIAARPDGALMITLDNGQVWHQIATGESFRLKVGDKVTVKPGALGSYSMASPYGRSAKVKRVR